MMKLLWIALTLLLNGRPVKIAHFENTNREGLYQLVYADDSYGCQFVRIIPRKTKNGIAFSIPLFPAHTSLSFQTGKLTPIKDDDDGTH